MFPEHRAAGLLIERQDNKKVFLALRSSEVSDPFLWSIPGGGVEPGESDEDAAVREAYEELGSIPHMRITGRKEVKYGTLTYTTFFARIPGEVAKRWTPILNDENDDYGWFSIDSLPYNVHPGLLQII